MLLGCIFWKFRTLTNDFIYIIICTVNYVCHPLGHAKLSSSFSVKNHADGRLLFIIHYQKLSFKLACSNHMTSLIANNEDCF